jgi:hypothetical protein
MKKYCGRRNAAGDADVAVVDLETHESKMLDPGLKYINHSPTGFAWGYLGSGPAQLAFAILLDHFGDVARATWYYQDFKFRVIAMLPVAEPWEITTQRIEEVLNAIRLERSHVEGEGIEAWDAIS